MVEFRLKFHWSLFLRVELTIFQHWFRLWLGAAQAAQATSHYLNQWWLAYWRICASLGLNELNIHRVAVKIRGDKAAGPPEKLTAPDQFSGCAAYQEKLWGSINSVLAYRISSSAYMSLHNAHRQGILIDWYFISKKCTYIHINSTYRQIKSFICIQTYMYHLAAARETTSSLSKLAAFRLVSTLLGH